jgi:hypothetical protein
MSRTLSIACATIAALALIATDEAWAGRGGGHGGGGRGGSHSGGRHSGAARFSGGSGIGFAAGGASSAAFAIRSPTPLQPSVVPHRHHHHGRAVIFVGAPFLFWSWPYGYYYAPPPYYYGPDYVSRDEFPGVYVEKFDGTPTPQTPGEIYCPGKQEYYPDVQDCPNGWQRVIREPVTEAPAESG